MIPVRRFAPAGPYRRGGGFNEGSMKKTQAHRWRRQRGSALLLTLLLTLAGAALLGLTVDATSLLWARSNAQTTADLAAAAVALELERSPAANLEFLSESARASAALNGYRHGSDSVSIQLERQDGKTSILVERDAGVFFMRMVRPHPVAIRARAAVQTGIRAEGL